MKKTRARHPTEPGIPLSISADTSAQAALRVLLSLTVSSGSNRKDELKRCITNKAMILCQRTSKGKGGNPNPTNLTLPSCKRIAWENLPQLRAGMTELIFSRMTTPLSSSFRYSSDAKSASRLAWCNAESGCSQSQSDGKGNVDLNLSECCHCPRRPHECRGQGETAKGRMSSGGRLEEVTISVWFGSLPYSNRTAAISEAFRLRYLSFQLNSIK